MSSPARLRGIAALFSASLIVIGGGGGQPSSALADEPVPPPVDENPPGVELTELRTTDTRTFATSDGTYVTQFFTEPVFYKPAGSSEWAPIDTSFVSVNRMATKAAVDNSPAQIDLAAADAPAGFLKLSGDGHEISFGLPDGVAAGRAGTQPVVKEDGAYVEYADFLPGGIDLRVFPHSDGFKSFLVLDQKPASNSFTLAIDAPGLTLAADPDGTYAFTDRAGNIVGRIPRPYLLDSSEVEGRGGGIYSEAVTMSLRQEGGIHLLILTVDPAFLESAVYPIYVDPTTTDFPTPQTTAQDTFASEKYPGSNFNTYQRPDSPYYYELWHGKEPGTNYYNEVYLRFKDLRATLGDVHVKSAYLEFNPYHQYYDTDPRPTWVRRVTSDWGGGSLTWNNRPSVASSDLGSYDTVEDVWSHIDVTTFVANVLDETWDNHGLMLHANGTGQGNWKRIASLGQDDPDLRPHMTVTWYLPEALIDSPEDDWTSSGDLNWTFDDGDGDPDIASAQQAQYEIEVATAEAFGAATIASSGTVADPAARSWAIPTGTSLADQQTYYWRVRVHDGSYWSTWDVGSFHWLTDDAEGTGIDPDNSGPTDPELLGYSYSDILHKNAEIVELEEVEETQGQCPGDPPCPPTVYLLPGFINFHQKNGLWCVPATIQSILDHRLGGWTGNLDPQGNLTHAGVLARQDFLKEVLIAKRNEIKGSEDPNYVPVYTFGDNGVGARFGLAVVNEYFAAEPDEEFRYVDRQVNDLSTFKRLSRNESAKWGMPLFVEVNARSPFLFWHFSLNSSKRLTHATLISGYDDYGDILKVADPYVTSPSQVNQVTRRPQWAIAGEMGFIWTWPSGDLFEARDKKTGHKPIWW